MILTIGVGNSHIVLGGFNKEVLTFTARLSSAAMTADEMAIQLKAVLDIRGAAISAVEGTIISSVVPPITDNIVKALLLLLGKKPILVGPGIKTGINILIDNPAQLGSDILVNSVAAACLYPKPVIVADMGTATTLSVINDKNCMIGGAILPGVGISLYALSTNTAQLPQINIEAPKKAIGTNTIDCMKSGIVLGNASMLDGMLSRFEEEIGKPCTTVATGGFAEEICRHTKRKICYNPHLLLEGLYVLYKKNTGGK